MKPTKQRFLSLDLELNNQEVMRNAPGYHPEVIQIGISVGEISRVEDRFSSYILETNSCLVKIDDPIDPFITQLTGITTEQNTQHGLSIKEAYEFVLDIKNRYSVTGPVVQWGGGDLNILRHEFDRKYNGRQPLGRRFIDVKSIIGYTRLFDKKSIFLNLSQALAMYDLEFQGQKHDAAHDARNTLRLFFNLMERQSKFLGLTVPVEEPSTKDV